MAYITKYALTKGIVRREVHDCFDISLDMVADVGSGNVSYHGNDWYRTYDDALRQAESMRLKKISSLKKQIAKLEKMTFAEPPEATR